MPKPKPSPRKPKKGIPRINRKRMKARRELAFGPYGEWIRGKQCAALAAGHLGRIEAAHVKSRGAGGKAEANLLPLCTVHHSLQHNIGWSDFEDRYLKADRFALAAGYWKHYQEQLAGVTHKGGAA